MRTPGAKSSDASARMRRQMPNNQFVLIDVRYTRSFSPRRALAIDRLRRASLGGAAPRPVQPRPDPVQPIGQRSARHVGHDEPGAIARFLDAVNVDDVRVKGPGCDGRSVRTLGASFP